MTRRAIEIDGGTVLSYGHYGRPVVVFPSEEGEAHDWEERGHGRRGRRTARSGQGEALLRAVVRPRELDAP